MKLPNRDQLKTLILYMMVLLTGLAIMLCFMMLEVVFVMKYELSRPSDISIYGK